MRLEYFVFDENVRQGLFSNSFVKIEFIMYFNKPLLLLKVTSIDVKKLRFFFFYEKCIFTLPDGK